MLLNLDSANWHWLTNLPPDSRALDLGAGTGTTSHALATRFREVIALEPVREQVDFMHHRFLQEGLSNVRIVRSSVWILPFEPQSFDLIVMNGVLERVAEDIDGDPGKLQEDVLRKAVRLLKPGGCLYLGFANRIWLRYLTGHTDPNAGVPFVMLLPRPIAQWYARRKGLSQGYRNYLYSSRGYRKLLRNAGLGRCDFYLAVPSFDSPRFLVPLKGNVYSYFARNFSRGRDGGILAALRSLLLKLRILKYFEYSFVVLARQ
jgi:SAM-dependent methyltransferase